jgi:KUP system potassium uptake protein
VSGRHIKNPRNLAGMNSRTPTAAALPEKDSPGYRLVVASLGVVFGDIGTSPTYAFRDCFDPRYGIAPTPANVIGLLSLMLWSLTLVISLKYVGIITKADNKGEGGVMALSTLVVAVTKDWRLWAPVSALGVFGAALFFGDGFITPPVSILGAMEGIVVAAPGLRGVVVPMTVTILTLLFLRRSAARARSDRFLGR